MAYTRTKTRTNRAFGYRPFSRYPPDRYVKDYPFKRRRLVSTKSKLIGLSYGSNLPGLAFSSVGGLGFGSPGGFSPLVEFEDRRLWNPEGIYAPAKSFDSSRHRLVESRTLRKVSGSLRSFERFSPAAVAFARPSRVLICVRRQQRREVMHALGHAGGVGQKSPRFSEYSSISCRG